MVSGLAGLAIGLGVLVIVGPQTSAATNWIEIDHGSDWTTRYAHLSAQSVSQGQKIGKCVKWGGMVGSSSYTSGFEYCD